ncbi:hypothetical protein NYE86_21010 [Actinacidiphila bryophytorum]|nr:hypothetical protein [Actinacidiphila bryophytorum]UWE13840.1 hypothetical protein NYE86_21010 [Actinacidiphila bryophytorum]
MAARFEQVTVVERDAVAEGAEGGAQFRAGVPQSRHVHILWSRGLQALEELLPGVGAQLEAAGAAVIDAPAQMRWLSPAGWFAGVPGTRYLSVSREVLESTLRQRILGKAGVTLLARHEATGFAAPRARARWAGCGCANAAAPGGRRRCRRRWWSSPPGAAPVRRSGCCGSAVPYRNPSASTRTSATPPATTGAPRRAAAGGPCTCRATPRCRAAG